MDLNTCVQIGKKWMIISTFESLNAPFLLWYTWALRYRGSISVQCLYTLKQCNLVVYLCFHELDHHVIACLLFIRIHVMTRTGVSFVMHALQD